MQIRAALRPHPDEGIVSGLVRPGEPGCYRSQRLRFPGEHLSVIVLCNRDDVDTGALATLVARLFLEDKMGPAVADEDEPEKRRTVTSWQPRDLARYAGNYFSAEAIARCALYVQDAKLVVEGCAEGAVLKPGEPGEFVDPDESFSLRFPDGGAGVGGFIYETFGLRGLPFERVKEPSK